MSKRFKFPLFLAAVMAVVLALSGCGSAKEANTASDNGAKTADSSGGSNTAGAEITIPNVWGEAKIQGTPSKIVALDFFIVDMLVSLGVSPAGVAGTGKTRVPAYIEDKVKDYIDVGERKEPNLEVISSIKPDLIIANPERAKTIQGDLEKITTSIALSDKSYKAILDNVDLLGNVLGKQDQAKQVRADLEKKIQDAKQSVKAGASVLVVGSFEDEMSVWVQDSFIGSMMTDLGLTYAYTGEKESSEGKADIAKLTVERLAELNPDYLFVYGDSIDKLKQNPLFQNMKAVKENGFKEVEQDLWARARGPIAAGLIIDQAVAFMKGEAK